MTEMSKSLPNSGLPQSLDMGQVQTVWPRFMLDAVRRGSKLVNLLPSHTSRWWPLVEDIFQSKQSHLLRSSMIEECVKHQEFRAISIDGTFRVCLSVLGQKPFNMKKSDREDAPFHGHESVSRAITVRGRTGAVVSMFPSPGEGAEDIQVGLQASLSPAALQQVLYVATDAPSQKLFRTLRQVLPNLVALTLDPVHLAMHYESSSARKKTAGSAALRRCLAKFSNQDAALSPSHWGNFFSNQDAKLTSREEALRSQILDGSMLESKARKLLTKGEAATVWVSRVEFLEQLAAISSAFRSEVAKKTEEGKSVGQLLWQAGQPDRLEYLFNNLRVRSAMSAAENLLLPTGTTSNESLHAEINGWFRQTQRLHRSTLKLKLDILTLSKLLSHNAALYSPTARQTLSSHVLARRLGAGLWTQEQWAAWAGTDARKKASLPIEKQRLAEKNRIKEFVAKRPATIKKRPSSKVHRTAFNLPRAKGIKRAGVHSRPRSSGARS